MSYNTKFLGLSSDVKFYIKGYNTYDAVFTNEFCFGYDDYNELYLLNVYQIKSGIKFASIEIARGLYAYWSVSLE